MAGTRCLGAITLAVLVAFALVVGEAKGRQAEPRPVAVQTAVAGTGTGAPRPRHHHGRRCDLRNRADLSSVPAVSFLATATGNLVPMHALTCLRRTPVS